LAATVDMRRLPYLRNWLPELASGSRFWTPTIPAVTDHIEIGPSASRLVGALRDVGYSFPSAVADLVDNSIAADATLVDIALTFSGADSWIRIADNGTGMTRSVADEAMRFGTRREYNGEDLGRFGLGLKTASISQCRRVTVATRAAARYRRISIRRLDLDHIERSDRWEVEALPASRAPAHLTAPVAHQPGTVVVWENLDRVLDYHRPDGGWARRRFERLGDELAAHLGVVFHRFLTGEARRRQPLRIVVDGRAVAPWDPFAREEPQTVTLAERRLSLDVPGGGVVVVRPFVLPHRSAFSSAAAFERLAGPLKWNRQQGLYIYRSDRLIHGGGWAGLRAVDEHTKYARAALDFPTGMDDYFKVNVAKMTLTLPAPVRQHLEAVASELCSVAAQRYRRGELAERNGEGHRDPNMHAVGVALRAAAMEVGEGAALQSIARKLGERNPGLASGLGW
jgi:hypothetical protein